MHWCGGISKCISVPIPMGPRYKPELPSKFCAQRETLGTEQEQEEVEEIRHHSQVLRLLASRFVRQE
jgi:hypothetical protein